VSDIEIGNGFVATKLPDDVLAQFTKHNKEIYGVDPIFMGMGGSIPFMGVFKKHFPEADFVLTGACLASSNIHSANENLDLEMCRKFTTVVGRLLSSL
jgi:acetylornithine deacetylase/succinyl-diaminopimelate desuccinylase-like protein